MLRNKKHFNNMSLQLKADMYVDGSYRQGRSGYGVVVLTPTPTYIYGGFRDIISTWQMAAELKSVIRGLEYVMAEGFISVTIYYDCKGIEFWADPENRELTIDKHPIYHQYNTFIEHARKNIHLSFEKVTAHAGNKYNEYADNLAKLGSSLVKDDISYDRVTSIRPHYTPKRKKYINRIVKKYSYAPH